MKRSRVRKPKKVNLKRPVPKVFRFDADELDYMRLKSDQVMDGNESMFIRQRIFVQGWRDDLEHLRHFQDQKAA